MEDECLNTKQLGLISAPTKSQLHTSKIGANAPRNGKNRRYNFRKQICVSDKCTQIKVTPNKGLSTPQLKLASYARADAGGPDQAVLALGPPQGSG